MATYGMSHTMNTKGAQSLFTLHSLSETPSWEIHVSNRIAFFL